MKNESLTPVVVVFRDDMFHEVATDEKDALNICEIRNHTGRMSYRTITEPAQVQMYLRLQQMEDWKEKHAE